MKNKSKFLLLPATFLMLTACGTNANTKIPRGYSEVDVNDSAARDAFYNKAAEDVALTYQKAMVGFKAKGSFGIKELSFSEDVKYKVDPNYKDYLTVEDYTNSFKLTDAEMDYTIGIIGLDKGVAEAKALVEISDLGFNFELTEKGKTYSLKASGVDVGAYYSNGNVYFNLGDKDLKNLVNSVIDLNYQDSKAEDKAERIKKDKEEAAKYLDKVVVKNALDSFDDVDDILKSLPNGQAVQSLIPTLQDGIKSAFDKVLKDEKARQLIKLYEDKNSKGVAVGVALGSDDLEIEGGKLSGDLKAAISFDKEGIFSSYGFEGNANFAYERKYSGTMYEETEKIQAALKKLDFGAEFEYGEKVFKLPGLDGYKEVK